MKNVENFSWQILKHFFHSADIQIIQILILWSRYVCWLKLKIKREFECCIISVFFHRNIHLCLFFSSFYVGLVVFRTMVTTPFYCYGLKMHDCILAITGLLVSIASSAVTGTATKVHKWNYLNVFVTTSSMTF